MPQTERQREVEARLKELSGGLAKRQGLSPKRYVGLDVASDTPFDDRDDPLGVVFPRGEAKKPGDVSFLLGRLRGETVTRARLIFAPELRDAVRAAVSA